MDSSWFLKLLCLLYPTLLNIIPCRMSPVPSSNSHFWQKFCRLFCPFPSGCSADVYLSLQQKQMLLERQGLLATLQSFPGLLQDNDELQHTTLVTLEEHQRALVLMRYKDFFHPRETLPSATVKPSGDDRVATSVTQAPDARIDSQQVRDTKVGLEPQSNSNTVRRERNPAQKISNHVQELDNNLPERTSIIDLLKGRFAPDVDHNNHISPWEISTKSITVQSHMWNQTKTLSEHIENTISIEQSIDINKFQQILSALPDVVLFNALCRKCAASVRQSQPRKGRKLLRLIFQNNKDVNNPDNQMYNQDFDEKLEFRTESELFNSIGRPETISSEGNKDNYIANARDSAHLSDVISEPRIAAGIGQSIFGLTEEQVIPGLLENAKYQSIVDQFHKAEASRQWQLGVMNNNDDGDGIQHRRGNKRHHLGGGGGRRRGKRMVMKTQVCPVVQSWSNLVLAKTANDTLVQIAQFPEVNLEQWFLEEKCKYPISPILDDVTCEVKDRLVDAVIIPVSNPTLPIQTMKIKIQCCVSMYNLDDGRN